MKNVLQATRIPTSTMTPATWLAEKGQLTPGGFQATYRSSPHASLGLRLAFREHVAGEDPEELEARCDVYRKSWEQYVQHGDAMAAVVDQLDADDVEGAADTWNGIDQEAVNRAFRVLLGEREPYRGRNLVTHVWREFDLDPCPSLSVPADQRDRALRPSDSNRAWDRSGDGRCHGCGTATIRPSQRDRLHSHLKSHPLFDTSGVHRQHNGVAARLWPQVTIAAKAVAEHVVPRCQGGATDQSNLTNACAACNYSRGDTSLDATSVVAYQRANSEVA